MHTKQLSSSRRAYVGCMKALMYLCAGLTGALVLFLVAYVLVKGLPNITWELLSTSPSYLSDRIGIYRRHSQFMKGKIYYQTFRLCSFTTSMPNSARFSLYFILPSLYPHVFCYLQRQKQLVQIVVSGR